MGATEPTARTLNHEFPTSHPDCCHYYGGPAGSDRNELVSWLMTYFGDLQPTYTRVIIHLLSTMDIPVGILLMVYYSSHVTG